MVEKQAKILNANGIHCRPSAAIIKVAQDYPGTILVKSATGDADLRSVIGLICLGLSAGTEVTVQVSGPEEDAFADKLVSLFAHHFDFPPRED